MNQHVCGDIGNFATKGVCYSTQANEERSAYFRSALVPVSKTDYQAVNANGMHADCIIINNQSYFMDELALRRQPVMPQGTDRLKVNNWYYPSLVVCMLSRMYMQSMKQIDLLLTYSPRDEGVFQKTTNRLLKGKTFTVIYQRREMVFTIKNLYWLPEPVAALHNVMIDDNFRFNDNFASETDVLLLDSGGLTSDVTYTNKGQTSWSETLPIGMHSVVRQLDDNLHTAFPEMQRGLASTSELHNALVSGVYNKGKVFGTLEVQEQVEAAMRDYLNTFMEFLVQNDLFNAKRIFVAGGGGAAIIKPLEARIRAEFVRQSSDKKESKRLLEDMDNAGETFLELADKISVMHLAIPKGGYKALKAIKEYEQHSS